MTRFELLTLIMSFIAVILIPCLILMIRGAIKWTRTEDKLSTLVDDIHEMVLGSEKIHAAMYEQMREDRSVTDKRLRFIEEWFMRGGPHAR